MEMCLNVDTSPFLSITTNTVYTHPTSSGNKHIPSGGSGGVVIDYLSYVVN